MPAKKLTLLLAMLLCLIVSSCRKNSDSNQGTPDWVILETDIGSSTDDLIALDLLYRAHELGKLEFKAIMVNREGYEYARVADIFNTYYKHPETAIGVVHNGVKNPPIFIDYWKMSLPDTYTDEPRFPTTLSDEEIAQLPDAVTLYRKILSEAADGSVNIVSVGLATNLARLLLSQPDEFSPLNGVELVRKKVKALYQQAGTFGNNPEPEFNFMQDPENAAILISKWPTPIYFSPMESGQQYNYEPADVLADLESAGFADSPLYHVYSHHNCNTGQRMWDAMCPLQLIAPEMFTLEGPFESKLDDQMILHNTPNPNSNHYVQVPPKSAEEHDKVMAFLRDWVKNNVKDNENTHQSE